MQRTLSLEPRLLQKQAFLLLDERGLTFVSEISAVLVPISKERASIMFVDNKARVIYGQLYVSDYDKNEFVNRFVNDVMARIRTVYQKEVETALGRERTLPLAGPVLPKIRETIAAEVQKDHS